MHLLRLHSALAGGPARQALRQRLMNRGPLAVLGLEQQPRRPVMIERKGEEGLPYSSGGNGTNRGRLSRRTTLSAYEVMAAKVGRFDRSLDALYIDAKGEVTNKTSSIKELLLNTDMHVRDLMALSPDSLHKKGGRLTPVILPRGDVIIFVMHPLRLVITKDSCLAFDPGDPTVQSVIADIASAIKIQQLEQAHAASSEAGNYTVTGGAWEVAYELIVMEQALRSFSNQFARIAELLTLIVETQLTALVDEGQGNEEQLFKLVPLKDGLAVAHANMQEVVDVIKTLLDSDEDMLGMMLTEKSNVKGDITCLDPALHSEVELLLENYHRQLVLIGAQINILRQRVQSAQEVFAINVDLHRNRVLRTTLLLTMLSTSFASAAAVASFFGMNLVNGLESHTEAFQNVVQGSCALAASLFLTSFALVRGQGKDRMRQDLNSVQAYQSIFKHIRSVSQAIYLTAMDPFDGPDMGPTREFRQHFRKLLSETRHGNVSYHEVDILLDLITRSAETLREQRKLSKDTSEEYIYRKLFESLGTVGGLTGGNSSKAAAAAAGAGAGGADGKRSGSNSGNSSGGGNPAAPASEGPKQP